MNFNIFSLNVARMSFQHAVNISNGWWGSLKFFAHKVVCWLLQFVSIRTSHIPGAQRPLVDKQGCASLSLLPACSGTALHSGSQRDVEGVCKSWRVLVLSTGGWLCAVLVPLSPREYSHSPGGLVFSVHRDSWHFGEKAWELSILGGTQARRLCLSFIWLMEGCSSVGNYKMTP